MNVLDELKRLDAERDKLITKAKGDALKNAEDAIESLNALGFNYRLVEGGSTRRAAPSARTGTRTPKEGPCPICNFRTDPPHDRRSHRSQKVKAPFTKEELAERGLTVVE